MIKNIIKRRKAVFVFSLLLILLGTLSYYQLPRERFPEIRRPLIFISTPYPGVSAFDMETLVTRTIEKELDGVIGVENLTSQSRQAFSQVTVEFSGDVPVETALRRVKERVDIAKASLPKDALEPRVRELNFSDMPVMILSLSHPSGVETLDLLSEKLEDSLQNISGVMSVDVSGRLEKGVMIKVDPRKLRHYNFSIFDVQKSLEKENISIPGGKLEGSQKDYTLAVSGEITEAEEFKQIIIQKDERKIRLAELAEVSFGFLDPKTYSRLNQAAAISFSIKKRGGENIQSLARSVKKIVNEFEKNFFPYGTKYSFVSDHSRDVKNMIFDLENNMLTGLLFVLLITILFLGVVNAGFVSLAIPFSMLITFIVLGYWGLTLNMVVLFSLTLGLGMLVDNGIVVVENIYRHRSLGEGQVEAAIRGTKEVAWPIITSTMTTVLAFFPILFMPGIMGEFMVFLPKTVIIVLLASLVVALSITPCFCSRFLKAPKTNLDENQKKTWFEHLQFFYRNLLRRSLKRKFINLFLVFIFVLCGFLLFSRFGKDSIFFPQLDPVSVTLSVKNPAGTPLELTNTYSKKIGGKVSKIESSAETIQTTSGKASGRGQGLDSSQSSVRIGFKPFSERKIPSLQTIKDLEAMSAKETGAEFKVRARRGGPPSGHDVSYEIRGQDYQVMEDLAGKVRKIVDTYRVSFEQVDSDYEASTPEIGVEVDRKRAGEFGLDTSLIARTVRTAISGKKVSTFRQGKEEYDVRLQFLDKDRQSLSDLKQVEVVTKKKRIPLSSLVNLKEQSSVSVIKHRDRKRAIGVWADFLADEKNKYQIKKEIAQKVASIKIPQGYEIAKGKGQSTRKRSTDFLKNAFMTALFLIFLVLVIQFNSVTQPFIILLAVLLSMGGVFWGLWLSGKEFVIMMSGIGMISLAGVVVNNGIVLIDFINHLEEKGKPLEEAVVEGAVTRLRPVLLTAITTIIGLLPMAFGISFDFHTMSLQLASESSAFWSPMALTVIFGLSFATILTLFVVPWLVLLSRKIFA